MADDFGLLASPDRWDRLRLQYSTVVQPSSIAAGGINPSVSTLSLTSSSVYTGSLVSSSTGSGLYRHVSPNREKLIDGRFKVPVDMSPPVNRGLTYSNAMLPQPAPLPNLASVPLPPLPPPDRPRRLSPRTTAAHLHNRNTKEVLKHFYGLWARYHCTTYFARRIADLEEKLDSSDARAVRQSELLTTTEQAAKENSELQGRLAAAAAREMKLEQEVDALQQKAVLAKQTNEQHASEVFSLKQQVAEVRDSLLQAEHSAEVLAKENAALQEAKAGLEGMVAELNAAVEALTREKASIDAEKRLADELLDSAKAENGELSAKYDTCNEELARAKAALEDMKVLQSQTDIDGRMKITELEEAHHSIQVFSESEKLLKEQVNDLRALLERSDEEATRLRDSIADHVKRKNDSESQQVADLTATTIELQSKLGEASGKIAFFESEQASFKEHQVILQSRVRDTEQQLQDTQAQLHDAKKRSTTQAEEYQKAILEKETALINLRALHSEVTQQLQDELDRGSRDVNSCKAEVRSLAEQLESARKAAAAASEELDKVSAAHTTLVQQLESTKEELKVATDKVVSLEQQLNESCEKLEGTERDMAAIEARAQAGQEERLSVEARLQAELTEKAALEERLQAEEGVKTALEARLQRAIDEKTELEARVQADQEWKLSLEQELEAGHSERQSLEQRLEASLSEKLSLEQRLEAELGEKQALEQRLEAARCEREALEEKYQREASEKEALTAKWQESEARCKEQAVKVDELATLVELRSHQLGTAGSESQQAISRLHEELAAKCAEATRLQQEAQETETALVGANTLTAKLQQQLSDREAATRELENQLEQEKATVAELAEKVQRAEEKAGILEHELVQVNESIVEQNRAMDEKEAGLRYMTQRAAGLEEDVRLMREAASEASATGVLHDELAKKDELVALLQGEIAEKERTAAMHAHEAELLKQRFDSDTRDTAATIDSLTAELAESKVTMESYQRSEQARGGIVELTIAEVSDRLVVLEEEQEERMDALTILYGRVAVSVQTPVPRGAPPVLPMQSPPISYAAPIHAPAPQHRPSTPTPTSMYSTTTVQAVPVSTPTPTILSPKRQGMLSPRTPTHSHSIHPTQPIAHAVPFVVSPALPPLPTVPVEIMLTAPAVPSASGRYVLAGGECPLRGLPVWASGEKRLFAGAGGRWLVGAHPGSIEKNRGCVRSAAPHGKQLPHMVTRWEAADGKGGWIPAIVHLEPSSTAAWEDACLWAPATLE